MALTMAQIASLLQQAREAGLSDVEIQAFEFQLLDEATQLTGAERLALTMALLPDKQLAAATTFVEVMATARQTGRQHLATALGALSDDEWNAMFPTETDDGATA